MRVFRHSCDVMLSVSRFFFLKNRGLFCVSVVPENIYTSPTDRIGNSWGVGGSQRPKILKKCIKFNWNFQKGGEFL